MHSTDSYKTSPTPIASTLFIAILAGGAIGIAVANVNPILIFAGIIALLVSGVILFNIEIGLLVMLALTYSRTSDVLVHYYNAPSIAKPNIALLLGAVIFQWIFFMPPPRTWVKAAFLITAYGVVIFTSLFYAANFERASSAIGDYWKDGIIAVLIVMSMRSGKTLQRAVWTLIGLGVVLGTISVFQYLTGSFTNDFWGFGQASIKNIAGETEGYRISGPIGDPNFFAQIMLVLFPISLVRFLDEKRLILRAIALWGTTVTLLTVIFTFSRGGFVSLIMIGVALFIFIRPRVTQMGLITLFLVLIAGIIPATYTDRLLTINLLFTSDQQQSVRQDVSFRGRASEMAAAWMMFSDHPLVGVGAQNYPIYYQNYSRRIGLDPRTEERQAHNLFIEIASEMGLFGIFVFGTILVHVFQSLFQSWKRLRDAGEYVYSRIVMSIATGVIGYFSASMFIHAAFPRYMWLLIGISFAIPHVTDVITGREQDA